MRTNDRLYRALSLRHLGAGLVLAEPRELEPVNTMSADVKLFAMTFAAGFLFTTIFIA